MMLVALIMRPWLVRMHRLDLEPRVLADDLLILSTDLDRVAFSGEPLVGSPGEHLNSHLEKMEAAFDATHRHLQALGAKISPGKCYLCFL